MKHLPIIICILASLGLLFVMSKFMYNSADEKKQSTDEKHVSALEIKSNDWAVGKSDAKAVVVEYLDFECEACQAYYPVTTQLKEEFKDDMQFVVRYFPLPGHRNSRTAAYTAEAAGKQGKFWEMYDLLFTSQEEWADQERANQEQFEKYVTKLGLDLEQWRKDVKSADVINRVDKSYEEAASLDLRGTPSFFLNGRKIENPAGYEAFKKLIQDELKK